MDQHLADLGPVRRIGLGREHQQGGGQQPRAVVDDEEPLFTRRNAGTLIAPESSGLLMGKSGHEIDRGAMRHGVDQDVGELVEPRLGFGGIEGADRKVF